MGKTTRRKFRKGAASFYIVAFATLILMVVATSFVAIIISEVERTSNDDLSQSAYDAALAGVEDAKSFYMKYSECFKNKITDAEREQLGCAEQVAKVQDNCLHENIQEVQTGGNNMQEEYTCVKLKTALKNYGASLSSSNPTKVVKVEFANTKASEIQKVKISWYNEDLRRFSNFKNGSVTFPAARGSVTNISAPPTLMLALLQTAEKFNLSQFDTTDGERTNRGMIYLVPTSQDLSGDGKTYRAAKNGKNIDKYGFLDSNNKRGGDNTNLPYAVKCDGEATGGYACEAIIDLPEPVNGARSDETFAFVVGVPYGTPTTRFEMSFYCGDGANCGNAEGQTDEEKSLAVLSGPQVEVDSTGRANDLFRRVVTRLEDESDYALSLLGPLELLPKNSGEESLSKKVTPITEWNFYKNL